MPEKPKAPEASPGATVTLHHVAAAIARALEHAKTSMDRASAEAAKQYQKDDVLAAANLPFFDIAEASVRLKVAFDRVDDQEQAFVVVDSSSLAKLPMAIVSEIELKFVSRPLRGYLGEGGKPVYAPGS